MASMTTNTIMPPVAATTTTPSSTAACNVLMAATELQTPAQPRLQPELETASPSRQESPGGLAKPRRPTNFCDLPPELRTQIWDEAVAACPPRFHRIWVRNNRCLRPESWSRHGNPAVLRVCVEARERALRRLTVAVPIHRYDPHRVQGPAVEADAKIQGQAQGLDPIPHIHRLYYPALRYMDPRADVVFVDIEDARPDLFVSELRHFGGCFEAWDSAGEGQGAGRGKGKGKGGSNGNKGLRRLALRSSYWHYIWTRSSMLWKVAMLLFGRYEEIYIVAVTDDLLPARESAEQEAMFGVGSGVGMCCGGQLCGLLPECHGAREILAREGWDVVDEVDGRTLRVSHRTDPSVPTTRIRDFFDVELEGVDLGWIDRRE